MNCDPLSDLCPVCLGGVQRVLEVLLVDAKKRAAAHQIGWQRVVVLNDIVAELGAAVAVGQVLHSTEVA